MFRFFSNSLCDDFCRDYFVVFVERYEYSYITVSGKVAEDVQVQLAFLLTNTKILFYSVFIARIRPSRRPYLI